MSKKIKYLFVISILVLSLLLLPFSVSAVTGENYNFPFQKPTVTDFSCYFEVLTTSGNAYVVFVFADPARTSSSDTQYVPYFQLTSSSSSLSIGSHSFGSNSSTLHGLLFSSSGSFSVLGSQVSNVIFSPGQTIAAIHYYGNVENLTPQSFSSQPPFTFSYAAEGVENSFLSTISSYLYSIGSDTNEILSYVEFLEGMSQDTSEILDYLTSILESNQIFYEELDNYFQDNNWSLLSNIDTNLHLFLTLFDPRQDNNLYDYLFSMSQDSSDILYYLSTFNDYFQGADWSLLDDIQGTIFQISQDSENIWFSLNDFYDSFIEYGDSITSYFSMLLDEGYGVPEYDPPSDVSPPRDDSTIQDIEDAEQEALGGMTQEEVKEQVDEVLDSSSKAEEIGATEINVNNIAVVNNLFTDMFGVFGGAWSTFFLLNLTVAFAAFLIGRRY